MSESEYILLYKVLHELESVIALKVLGDQQPGLSTIKKAIEFRRADDLYRRKVDIYKQQLIPPPEDQPAFEGTPLKPESPDCPDDVRDFLNELVRRRKSIEWCEYAVLTCVATQHLPSYIFNNQGIASPAGRGDFDPSSPFSVRSNRSIRLHISDIDFFMEHGVPKSLYRPPATTMNADATELDKPDAPIPLASAQTECERRLKALMKEPKEKSIRQLRSEFKSPDGIKGLSRKAFDRSVANVKASTNIHPSWESTGPIPKK